MAAKIEIYSKAVCSYCGFAKKFFESKGLLWQEHRIDQDPMALQRMQELTSARTVPQIVINGRLIGGYDDMMALQQSGELEKLLNNNNETGDSNE